MEDDLGYDEPIEQQQDYKPLSYDPYNPLFSANPYDNKIGLVKELSPRHALITSMVELRGEIRDPDTGEKNIKVKPMMNEDGISVFFQAVTAAANDINTFSNYRTDDKLIYALMNKWIMDITYEFYYHYHEYGIKQESHCSIVINKAVGLMLPSFFKALGAGDRSAATRSVSEMIQRATRDTTGGSSDSFVPQKKGVLARMNPFA